MGGAAPADLPAGGRLPQRRQPRPPRPSRARGTLICGVNTGLAGFAQPDSQGVWRGFDVDYCRAVAIALFDDADKVRFVPTTAQNRFTALQSGEVDMLSRNTTWTLSRDTSLGFDFAGINFYDGQGFMVKRVARRDSGQELNGATICVQPGTTTEQNLTDWAAPTACSSRPVVIERLEEVVARLRRRPLRRLHHRRLRPGRHSARAGRARPTT